MNIASPIASMLDDLIVKKVTSQILSVLGLATIPLIGGFMTVFVSQLLKVGILYLLEKTIIGGARLWLVANVNWHVEDMTKATDQLQHILDHPTEYTDRQMAEVEKDFDEKAVRLIRLTNARLIA